MNPPSIFQQQFDGIRPNLFLSETEETWDTIARSVTALTTACSDIDSYAPGDLLIAMRSISRPLISAMNSERSRLSGVAIDLVAVVASCLGVAFDPLLAHFFPVLLALSSRTSKVTVARARTCILAIIEATHLPTVLSYLVQSVTDKSVSLRLTIVESTLACMNCFNPPDLEKDVRAKEIEVIIRTTARDANADVRKVSKKVFEAYRLLLPRRLESFTTPLTPTTRKYLDIQSKVADKLKQSTSHPPSYPKAAQLSSSTSLARSSSSRRPQTHARSASSPAIAPDVGASGTTDQPPPRSRKKVDMAPPKPVDAIQTSRQAAVAQPTSVADRKRVVSMFAAVRPMLPDAKLGASERGRPTPTSNHPVVRRPQPVDETRQPSQMTSVVARRVPISLVQIKIDAEKAIRAHSRVDNSASTPATRHAPPALAGRSKPPASRAPNAEKAIRAHPRVDNSASTPATRHAPPALAEPSKPPAPRAPNKDATTGNRAMSKPKGREPSKQRSLMQPTLSQLSRAKTVERRAPVSTASKPQTALRKAQIPTTKGEQRRAPTVIVTPASSELTVPQSSTSDPDPQDTAVVTKEANAAEDEDDSECPVYDASALPKQDSEMADTENEEQAGKATTTDSEAHPVPSELAGPATPPKVERDITIGLDKTPISELLLSIERGFLFTPSAPLSPPQSYLPLASANLPIPFPLKTVWSSSGQPNQEPGETTNKEAIRHIESRRALGDVAINK